MYSDGVKLGQNRGEGVTPYQFWVNCGISANWLIVANCDFQQLHFFQNFVQHITYQTFVYCIANEQAVSS